MKRHGHLLSRVHAFDNLHAAWRKAGQGKRHKPEVVAFGVDREQNFYWEGRNAGSHPCTPLMR